MTRKEYRQQMNSKTTILTEQELNELEPSKKYAYIRNQQILGLPITTDGNHSKPKKTYKAKDLGQGFQAKHAEAINAVNKVLILDLVCKFVGLSK